MKLLKPLKQSALRLSCSRAPLILSLILCALITTACKPSGGWEQSVVVDVPSLSETALKGGTTIKWPQEPLTPQNTPTVVARLRQSEIRNARAVNACKAEYGSLQKLLLEKP